MTTQPTGPTRVRLGFRGVMRRVGIFRPILPMLLLIVGYFIPAMQVSIGMPDSNLLWLLLFGSFVVLVIWLIAEIMTTTDRNTPISHLQWDDFASLVIALAMTFFAGWQQGDIQWWLVFPWFGAVVDAVLSGYLAINNAAQKPLVSQQQ